MHASVPNRNPADTASTGNDQRWRIDPGFLALGRHRPVIGAHRAEDRGAPFRTTCPRCAATGNFDPSEYSTHLDLRLSRQRMRWRRPKDSSSTDPNTASILARPQICWVLPTRGSSEHERQVRRSVSLLSRKPRCDSPRSRVTLRPVVEIGRGAQHPTPYRRRCNKTGPRPRLTVTRMMWRLPRISKTRKHKSPGPQDGMLLFLRSSIDAPQMTIKIGSKRGRCANRKGCRGYSRTAGLRSDQRHGEEASVHRIVRVNRSPPEVAHR